MPLRAAKQCGKPGCGALTGASLCATHAREAEAKRRESRANGFKYDRNWRKRRAAWLVERPMCEECRRQGVVRPATDVDHVVALSAGGVDEEGNYQSLCHECHSAKTARDDGGFGLRRRDRGSESLGIGRR